MKSNLIKLQPPT